MKRNKLVILFIAMFVVIMAISFTGCSSTKTDDSKSNTATQQQDVEKQKLRAKAAVFLAEEKIPTAFDQFDDAKYPIAKDRYKITADIENYLKGFYSDAIAKQIVDTYVKKENLPNYGEVLTLQIPEDYVALTKDSKPTITVEGQNATVTSTEKGKTVTYKLVEKDSKWIVDSKEVK
ncbi:hypothetical protein [Tepidibacillus marianensis]|uniref:hypothetical protein n=1 Tax=Tepidibacillus marianensis TaxID=3131995 RepID=UPI0030CB0A23